MPYFKAVMKLVKFVIPHFIAIKKYKALMWKMLTAAAWTQLCVREIT